jgi:hypothetical protein
VGLDDLTLLFSASGAAAAGAGALLWAIYTRCFVTVPPNRALVLYGRHSPRRPAEPGLSPNDIDVHRPRIVVGGGVFVAPWNKGVGRLSLDPVSVDLSVRSMHALEGSRASGWEVRLQVQAKIPAEPGSLTRAAENLLGKTDEEIRALVGRTVEAAVPAVLSRVRLEEGEPDWDRLGAEIQAAVAPDLLAWGFVVQTLSVTELRRILPAETKAVPVPVKPLSSPGTAGEGGALDALHRGLDARLARAERNLTIVGASIARLYQEAKAAGERTVPFSVLDFPLGYEVPASVVPAVGSGPSLHESMEGDSSPLSPALSLDRAVRDRVRDDSPPLD